MKIEVSQQAQKVKVLALQNLNDIRGGEGFGMDASPASWSTWSSGCGGVGSNEWSTSSSSCR